MQQPPKSADSKRESYVRTGEKLTFVPTKVLQYPGLKHLNLGQNEIRVLPATVLSSLTGLSYLNVSNNLIADIPSQVSLLKALEVLDVSHNQLSGLPGAKICTLTGLRELYASSNSILYISRRFKALQNLKVLEVSDNQLQMLPSEIGWLPLEKLSVHGNPNLRIPKQVLDLGLSGLLGYLQIVGEQHKLVEDHMEKFTLMNGAAGRFDTEAVNASEDGDEDNPHDEERNFRHLVSHRLEVAKDTGILNLSRGLSSKGLPSKMLDISPILVVDVHFNQWSLIPSELFNFPGVAVLNLAQNDISSLPSTIRAKELAVLDLSFNSLPSLPPTVQFLSSLQQLYLANNYLTTLPSSIADLQIQDLFLSENPLGVVPDAVVEMTSLVKLSLSCCQLREIPDEIDTLQSLRFLDVSFNQIAVVPSSMMYLTCLNALNLCFNPLGTFPVPICHIHELQELNLDNTGVHNVPPEIGRLTNLVGLQMAGANLPGQLADLYSRDPLHVVQIFDATATSLDISGCRLTSLPTQLFRLTALVNLNISRNALTEVPPELALLTNLKKLDVLYNPLRPPYSKVVEAYGHMALIPLVDAHLTKLDLSGCELDSLHEEIINIHKHRLLSLKVASNNLRSIPETITALTALTSLILDNNFLTTLPDLLPTLPSLIILMAADNRIHSFTPTFFNNATKLQALILANNTITSLPPQVSCLTSLKALAVNGNQIPSLPNEITMLTALRMLDISRNNIQDLPHGISNLQKICIFKAESNQLLPTSTGIAELTALTALSDLQLASNPIYSVADPMNVKGVEAVKDLLDRVLWAGRRTSEPEGFIPKNSRQTLDDFMTGSRATTKAAEPVAAETSGVASKPHRLSSNSMDATATPKAVEQSVQQTKSAAPAELATKENKEETVSPSAAPPTAAPAQVVNLAATGLAEGPSVAKSTADLATAAEASPMDVSTMAEPDRPLSGQREQSAVHPGVKQAAALPGDGDEGSSETDGTAAAASAAAKDAEQQRAGLPGADGSSTQADVKITDASATAQGQDKDGSIQQADPAAKGAEGYVEEIKGKASSQEPPAAPAAAEAAAEAEAGGTGAEPLGKASKAAVKQAVQEAFNAGSKPEQQPREAAKLDAMALNTHLKILTTALQEGMDGTAILRRQQTSTISKAASTWRNKVVPEDPVRKTIGRSNSLWDQIPMVSSPKILAAVLNEPPAPPTPTATDTAETPSAPERPQNRNRFKRVLAQTTIVAALSTAAASAIPSTAAPPEE